MSFIYKLIAKSNKKTMIEEYFWAFINYKLNNWAKFLLIAKFIYNNTKNASIGYIFFKFNYSYYFYILYKENLDPYSKLKMINKLASKLKDLITLYWENLYYT